jgi:casein kinase II subunit beta
VILPDPFLSDFHAEPSDCVPDPESARALILTGSAHPGLEEQAQVLDGLAHRAYLSTDDALDQIYAKWANREFRPCPRTFCRKVQCLPCGTSEELAPLKMCCLACRETYSFADPRFEFVFGGFFGREYLSRLVQRHPQLAVEIPSDVYVPRIYGFLLLERPDPPQNGGTDP